MRASERGGRHILISRTHLRFALVTLLLLSPTSVAFPRVVGERPTPASWDQWQPTLDHSDERLEGRVSIWRGRIEVADLLDGLSSDSGVELLTIPDLASVALICYLRSGSLSSVMNSLADLLDGYWVFTRGGEPRVYCLTTLRPPPDLDDEYLMAWARETDRARNRPYAAEREQRMDLYRAGLALDPGHLLSSYEQADPWLCAELLDPVLRPMIEHVAGLGEQEQRQLVEYGRVEMPLRSLEPALIRHLARWSKGQIGKLPGYMTPGDDPDRFLPYPDPEAAWNHASVAYLWLGESLQLHLNVPGYGGWSDAIIMQASASPYFARYSLMGLGYRERSPEHIKDIEAETIRWQQSHGIDAEHPPTHTPPAAVPEAHSWQTDPRLSIMLDLTAFGPSARISIGSLLEQVALQCRLNAMAMYLSPDRYRIVAREDSAGAVLAQVEADRQGSMAWSVKGDYLLGADRNMFFMMATSPPDGLADELRNLLAAEEAVPLDSLASLLANLNILQVEALKREIPQLRELPVRLVRLRLYGALSPQQREALERGEELAVSDLTRREQGMLLFVARESRPWVSLADLEESTLVLNHVRLSTLDDGLSLVANYQFPDSEGDRDEVFRAPALIRLRP